MRNKRKFGIRRQNEGMPRAPFKDSRGATIRECRRNNCDRRISDAERDSLPADAFEPVRYVPD
jgi:hypothetical protein